MGFHSIELTVSQWCYRIMVNFHCGFVFIKFNGLLCEIFNVINTLLIYGCIHMKVFI